MKHSRRRRVETRSEEVRPPVPKGPVEVLPGLLPTPRRWLFRALAAVGIPVALLGVLEVALRLAGFGYPVTYFLEREQQGKKVLVPNEHFGLRFFPAEIARRPTPFVVPREKAPGTYRIFLFGESAALGDPRPAYGMGRYLQVMLEERFPATKFEVIPAAMTAINSHALRLMARECAGYDGDLWIIYMGNNEMAGPFGAATIFGPKAPSLKLVRTALAVRSTRTGQAMDALGRRFGGDGEAASSWEGLRMFEQQRLAPDAVGRAVVHRHFEVNLRTMIESGLNRHAEVLLCTVASNLRDCPPFASLHRDDWTANASNQWSQHWRMANAHTASNRLGEALTQFEEAGKVDPGYAEWRYRAGLVALALTNRTIASDCLAAARDLDALPFRADSTMNQTVRSLAREYQVRVGLVDVEQRVWMDTIPGHDWFLDHVHFTVSGNYRVARWLADAVTERLPPGMRKGEAVAWPSAETVDQRLGLTDWNRVRILESMMQRFLEAPYTHQLNQGRRLEYFARQIVELRPALHPRHYLEAEDLYRAAIARVPGDFRLHENFAEFLESSENVPLALEEWRKVADLLPWYYLPYFQMGRLYAREQKYEEARASLERTLTMEPNLDEARLEMGQTWYRQGRYEDALRVYEDIRKKRPENPRVLRYMADPLAASGRRKEAMDCLREAVRLRPGYWEARYFLGVEMAVDNQFEEAAGQFVQVLHSRPNHVLARLNLGVALVHLRRAGEARQQFEEVLRIDPENARARQHLESLSQLMQGPQAQGVTP